MANSPFFAAHGLNVQNAFQANATQFSFGANIVVTLSELTIGNSTVNSSLTSSVLQVGGSVLNSTALTLGSGVAFVLTDGSLGFGNSTVNAAVNSTLLTFRNATSQTNVGAGSIVLGSCQVNTTVLAVGANVFANVTHVKTGNTTQYAQLSNSIIQVASVSSTANLQANQIVIGLSSMNTSSIATQAMTAITLVASGNVQIQSLGVGTAATGTTGRIVALENIYAYFSDRRLKKDFQKIQNSLWKVNQLNGYTFEINDLAKGFGYENTGRKAGLIAQEVQAVLPEIVHLAPFDCDENDKSKSGENYLTIQNELLVPLLVEAIKELTDRVKDIELEMEFL